MSWVWQNELSTPSPGFSLIRAVPTSWIDPPSGRRRAGCGDRRPPSASRACPGQSAARPPAASARSRDARAAGKTGRRRRSGRHHFAARLPEQLLGVLLEVVDQLVVVVAVSEVDLADRNPPVILHFRIELDEVLFVREHLAARDPYSRLRDIAALDFLLPFRPVARKRGRELRKFGLPAGGIHDVAADEIFALRLLIDVLEVRDRDAAPILPSSSRLGPPFSFGRMPLTPPPPTWSIMYCPSVPLEFASPPFAESSSRRVFSSVEAARITYFASTSTDFFV